MMQWLQDNAPFIAEALENKYTLAVVVLFGSFIVAKGIELVLARVILRLAGKTKTDLDDRIVKLLRFPLFFSLQLYGIFWVVRILGYTVAEGATDYVRAVLETMVILVWTVALSRACHAILQKLSENADKLPWIDARTLPLLDNLAKIVVIVVAGYLVLRAWDQEVTPLLASAGIAGVAIGFAAKDTIANFFAGMFILADAPYKIGDFIILDSGERGKVTAIGLRSTRMLTRDDVEVTVPNAAIAAGKIVNESGGPWPKARVTVRVGVAYGSDIDKVERVLLEAASEVPDVSGDPAPRVRFTEFGDSSLNFRLLCWIDRPVLKGRCLHHLNSTVYKKFEKEGIEIPFPQRVVHLDQSGGG